MADVSTAAAGGGRGEAGWRLVLVLGALSAVSPLAIDMYLPSFPQIAKDLGATAGQVGWTLSVFLLGLSSGQLVWGPVSDRVGRRGPILGGGVVFMLAAVGCALAPSIWWLLTGRLLMGIGGSGGVVVARAVVRDLFDERGSAHMFSMMMVVSGIAPVIAPALGGAILTYGDWHAVFWVLAALGAACVAGVAVVVRETLPAERRVHGNVGVVAGRYWELARTWGFFRFALVGGFAYGVLFAYIASAPFVFIEMFGMSPQRFSLLFAGNAVGLFVGARVNRALLLRGAGVRTVLRWAGAVNVVSAVLLAMLAVSGAGGFVAFAGLVFLCVATLGLILPNSTAAAMGAAEATRAGTASALLGMVQYAVGAAGGAAASGLADGTARPMAGVMVACGAVAAAICWRSGKAR